MLCDRGKKGEPPRANSTAELSKMLSCSDSQRTLFNIYFSTVIYPAIEESPLIAEKYPDPADRTPHKLLGGLANIVSTEYMQSLEPHDPRRLFLDTLKPPSAKRHKEVDANVLLVGRVVTREKSTKKVSNYKTKRFHCVMFRYSIG